MTSNTHVISNDCLTMLHHYRYGAFIGLMTHQRCTHSNLIESSHFFSELCIRASVKPLHRRYLDPKHEQNEDGWDLPLPISAMFANDLPISTTLYHHEPLLALLGYYPLWNTIALPIATRCPAWLLLLLLSFKVQAWQGRCAGWGDMEWMIMFDVWFSSWWYSLIMGIQKV